ncbi:unnamed protein product [Mytilus coruscus]|uniref:Uncharacterized protein n=1 Tax=Mytilus coruscus TaxID=42192 RepID=A0A6J8EA78_MYTCO|nr:unnamed protein product [Mytilus coruscus]
MLILKIGNKITVDSFTFPCIDTRESINKLEDHLNQPSKAMCKQRNFIRCLDHFGLTEYYPDRIRMTDISTKQFDERNPKVEDIPWLYLKHILMCNSNCRSVLKDHFDVLNPINSFSDDGQRRSYIEIAEKLWSLISSIRVNATNSLLNMLRDNQSLDITIDESSDIYSSAKVKSKTLIGETEKESKCLILPLQHEPWHELTRVEKQLYKSSEYCSYAEKGLLQQEMTQFRFIQLQKLQNVNIFMQTFLNYIIKSTNSERDSTIFYTYLILCLNEKTEKEQFKVESEYFSALSSLKSEKRRKILKTYIPFKQKSSSMEKTSRMRYLV